MLVPFFLEGDSVTLVMSLPARIGHLVRYYFIDHGLSHQFLPYQTHVMLGWPRYGCTRPGEISAIRSIVSRRAHCWERFLGDLRQFLISSVFCGPSN